MPAIRGIGPMAIFVAGLVSGGETLAVDLTGRLSDSHGPVRHARIEILELHRSVLTGNNGSYNFADLSEGHYTLRISIAGETTKTVDKTIAIEEGRDVGADITLTAGSEAASGGSLDAILVTAARLPLNFARTTEYEAPNIVSVIIAEEIRELPDVSAAEALRRLPGVSAENDTGEARFINIRGLDSDLNGTTFAGVRLLPTNPSSPLGGGRAVAFDTIPAGPIGSATVTKTNSPDQDAEALGGTIELSPRRLGPNDKPFVLARLGTGYEDLRGTKIGDFELSAGRRFGLFGSESQVSAVGSIAYYEDRRGIDDLEASYADNQQGSPPTPDKAFSALQQRWYQNGRKRLGFGGELAYEPSREHRFYVDLYQTGYTENQYKDYLILNFPNGGMGAVPVPGNPNALADQIDFYERDLTDHTETLRARLASVGGRDEFGKTVLDYRISFTDGGYHVSKDLGPSFQSAAGLGVPITYNNMTNPNFPSYLISGGPNRFDPSIYSLNSSFSSSTEHDLDKEWSGVINLTRFLEHWGSDEQVKAGVSVRLRDKTLQPTQIAFASVPNVTLSEFVNGDFVNYYKNNYAIGPQINPNAFESFYARNLNQPNGFVEDIGNTTTANEQAFQHNKENVYALYGQYKVTFGDVGWLAGARLETTHASYAANAFNADTNTLIGLNSQDKSYTNLFPTVQARWEIAPRTLMRASISSAIARPGFQQISAAISVTPSNNSISQGNPALRPTTAYNFDWSLEHVSPNGSVVSLGLFDKELRNYIVQTATVVPVASLPQNAIYSGFHGATVTIDNYLNISQARAAGMEWAWEQKLTMLPGVLRGLGIGANWTWVSSRGDIGRGYTSQLPSTAKNTANAAIFYDMGPKNQVGWLLHVTSAFLAESGNAVGRPGRLPGSTQVAGFGGELSGRGPREYLFKRKKPDKRSDAIFGRLRESANSAGILRHHLSGGRNAEVLKFYI